jgi:hypothetical protein
MHPKLSDEIYESWETQEFVAKQQPLGVSSMMEFQSRAQSGTLRRWRLSGDEGQDRS